MKKILLYALTLLLSCSVLHAQKKKDLLLEIDELKSKLTTTEGELAASKKSEAASLASYEAVQAQIKELREANAALLKNLNSFAEVSNKNSENVAKTLKTLEEKEKQLKTVNDAIARNDSTAVVVLTNAKQTLGENAKLSVSNGAVIVSVGQAFLFGEEATSNDLTPAAVTWLEKIAAVLTANPDMRATVEGLSITGELDIAAQHATLVGNTLQKQYGIAADRISSMGKDGGFKEGINIKIHPKFDQFYLLVREHMKNGR
ncbi:hypothetical protein [Spongiimicrobium sp. 2-473A-2-J]|uniref:hypothetical protein n=1 Tax=Eudoraea algarum TaxID=3417568 RepID=UPI003D36F222